MENSKFWLVFTNDEKNSDRALNFRSAYSSLVSAKIGVEADWLQIGFTGQPIWHYLGERLLKAYDGNGLVWLIKQVDVRGNEQVSTIRMYGNQLKDGTEARAKVEDIGQPNRLRLSLGIYKDDGDRFRPVRETVVFVSPEELQEKWNVATVWVDSPDRDIPAEFGSTVESYRPENRAQSVQDSSPNITAPVAKQLRDWVTNQKAEIERVEQILKDNGF